MTPVDEELPPLDAPVRAWIHRAEELSATLPGLASAEPWQRREAARELSDLLAREYTDPVPDGVDIDDITLLGGDGPLRARRFRPSGADGALATMLWLHGGGWIGGTIDETLNDRTCADRALRSGVQLVSLEYRLAPEHPYPAPVDDAVAALADLRARADELGVDPAALGIGGNSAGATIAASAALRERDAGTALRHQALEVLPAALRPVGDSIHRHRRASGLDGAEHLADLYRGGAPLWAASPLDAPDLRGVAPALLLIAEFDPLRDGAVAYAEALRAAEVPVVVHLGAGHVHGSPGLTARWQGARDWRDRFAAELSAAYATPVPQPSRS
ncbi:alpha/beta hydrolase fold domain-containing protein [Streptomyces sp. AC495_CC817]|uniref:alpha/beta hydrolase fold domain-containing protein n=1 Tax=Streptomyces sp. AC495_CC817 TaxID=2823900 RepID=UPI001C270B27|nr:alpha/beta hydrolase fold domain-containing protein [Streptomyces sp. AC495_CC817]